MNPRYLIAGGIVLVGFTLVLPSVARASWAWPGWTPPIDAVATSGWGEDRAYRDGWHEGLDFPAFIGTPVYAVAAGEVAGVFMTGTNTGKYLVIDHGDFVTRYLHLDAHEVIQGQRVGRGERVARSGSTGIATAAPHLHFDVRATAVALAEYRRRFGEPVTGFPQHGDYWGVPGEPLVRGRYDESVLANARAEGVAV